MSKNKIVQIDVRKNVVTFHREDRLMNSWHTNAKRIKQLRALTMLWWYKLANITRHYYRPESLDK